MTTAAGGFKFDAIARTHVGLVRTNNEDAYSADGFHLAVADGVGGRPAGEVASAVTAQVVQHCVLAGVAIDRAAQAAGDTVRGLAAGNSLFTGMCSTLTAAVLVGDDVVLGHVGDSRAYRVVDGRAERLTADQTIAARMVEAGDITEEEAAVHPKRGTLFQAVGSTEVLEVEVTTFAARAGDRYILCTDGIAYAGEDVVARLLIEDFDASSLADALIDAPSRAAAETTSPSSSPTSPPDRFDMGIARPGVRFPCQNRRGAGVASGVWLTRHGLTRHGSGCSFTGTMPASKGSRSRGRWSAGCSRCRMARR